MPGLGLSHFELTLLLLLTVTAGFAVLARRIQVPYPIVLVIGGLLLGLVPHVPRVSLAPDVVFLVFLPPLLFSASFHISWRDFRQNLTSIVLLAFGLVGFTVFGVAAAARWLFSGFDWRLGLVLGAVVATTDAIAATATAKRLGLPRGITDLLEAESLVNDGSGLLALKFTVAIVVTGLTPSLAVGASQLLYLIAGAVIIGLLIGAIVGWLGEKVNDAPIEITISFITPYVTYLIAEAAHCSGVLATIACGLYLGHRSYRYFSLHARIEASAFWRTIDFILNGLVFLLLGLQLPIILADIRNFSIGTLVAYGVLFSVVVILLRLFWAYPGAWLSIRIRRHVLHMGEVQLNKREVFLVGWAGMRGVLALAAAFSLPEKLNSGAPFPQRSMIIFLAFCVIFATLVLQGLTMPMLIRRLGMAGSSETQEEERWARRQMLETALRELEQRRDDDQRNEESVRALESFYRRELHLTRSPESEEESSSRGEAERRRQLGRDLRAVERQTILRLRNEDKIHDETLRTLERELDLLDARFGDED